MPATRKKSFHGGKKMKCGNCSLCIKDDGSPYCAIKDLYTTVGLDDECDEQNIREEYYFTEDKK